jgi:hypothetical protein
VARLEALGEQLDGGDIAVRRRRAEDRPIAGTTLIREYGGVLHHVTVRRDGYEWQRRPYKSLSAIARAITGARWNGLGVVRPEDPAGGPMSKLPSRRLRCAIYARKSSEEGLEEEFNSLDAQREARRAYIESQRSEGWTALAGHYDDGGVSGGTLDHPTQKRGCLPMSDRGHHRRTSPAAALFVHPHQCSVLREIEPIEAEAVCARRPVATRIVALLRGKNEISDTTIYLADNVNELTSALNVPCVAR